MRKNVNKQAPESTRIQTIKDMLMAKRSLIMRDFRSAANTERHAETGDLCDQSSKMSEDHLNYRLSIQAAEQVKGLERSLEKLRRGEYGFCEDCGDDIPIKRLEANPTATRCITCQQENEETLKETGIKALMSFA